MLRLSGNHCHVRYHTLNADLHSHNFVFLHEVQNSYVMPTLLVLRSCPTLALHKPEDIVQDVVAAVSGDELEDLREVHRSLLFVDLRIAVSLSMQEESYRNVAFIGGETYKKCTGDHDENAAVLARWLCVLC